MDVVVARCAGLDVHKDTVVAAVRTPAAGGRDTEVRSFATFTLDLLALPDWLVERQVTLVAMESTGVYGNRSTPGTCATCPGARCR